MKILYISKTPFGEFLYEPLSRRGVAISEDGVVVLGMRETFDPRMYPSYKELTVDPEVFTGLTRCASRRSHVNKELSEALSRLPSSVRKQISYPRFTP